jgi:hypothetical protein
MILRLGKGAVRLFRNSTGQFRTEDGRVVRTGLCVGSSDVIGWQSVVVTPDMVGKRIAVFVAIEAKAETGRPTKEQLAFIAAVRAAGGIAGICRSSEDAEKLLTGPVDTYR